MTTNFEHVKMSHVEQKNNQAFTEFVSKVSLIG